MIKFSILITTKNRLNELKFTLRKIGYLIENSTVECIICDDGSDDGTFGFIKDNYPDVKLIRNEQSRGLIFSRNTLLGMAKGEYAISLDDDAHFALENPLEIIDAHFKQNTKCAVMAFRIFWGEALPKNLNHSQFKERVRGFVGCGHVWRMEAWKQIPNYPDWFIFYGEEDFASYQLFKKHWEVHYTPDVLVHHRVSIKSRKRQKDYRLRLRRSLRSGWYLYILFYPVSAIPKRGFYTLWIQIKTKVFKGDFRALLAILQALGDLVINFPRLLKHANRLSNKEFNIYSKLEDTKAYWNSKK